MSATPHISVSLSHTALSCCSGYDGLLVWQLVSFGVVAWPPRLDDYGTIRAVHLMDVWRRFVHWTRGEQTS